MDVQIRNILFSNSDLKAIFDLKCLSHEIHSYQAKLKKNLNLISKIYNCEMEKIANTELLFF